MEFTVDAINEWLQNYLKANPGIAARKWSDHDQQVLAQRLAWDLLNAAQNQTREHIPDNAIQVGRRVELRSGIVYYDIYFNGDFLWRNSLYQPKVDKAVRYVSGWKNVAARNGKYGTDNWVQMYEKGWHARDYVYGTIVDDHGFRRRVRSQKDRAGSHALRDVVERFNRTFDGAKATLHSDYI